MANGRGGPRPNSGRPPGSGNPVRRVLKGMSEKDREAAEELVRKINASNSNPLLVMAKICGDTEMAPEVRLTAARYLAPYCASPMPSTAHIQHDHQHTIDADALRQQFIDRMNALAASRGPIIDAEPAPALPEPEPVAE
jgi:hypothetical protein